MKNLKGFQKKYLRSLAHEMKPVIYIGYKGLTDTLIQSLEDALERHELIKVKFIDFKDQKKEITKEIEAQAGCEAVGLIGHIALLYRQNQDPEKRRIVLPIGKK